MICKAKWQPLNHEAKFGFSFGCCVRGLGFFKWGSKYHTPAASVREWQFTSMNEPLLLHLFIRYEQNEVYTAIFGADTHAIQGHKNFKAMNTALSCSLCTTKNRWTDCSLCDWICLGFYFESKTKTEVEMSLFVRLIQHVKSLAHRRE